MAVFPRHLLICTFIFMIVNPSTTPTTLFLVRADEQLIQSLCGKTMAPNRCLDCLNRNPESETADALGLTAKFAACAKEDTEQLMSLIDDLEKVAAEGPVKSALPTCSTAELEVLRHFESAAARIADRRYDEALRIVNEAKRHHFHCFQQFKGGAITPVAGADEDPRPQVPQNLDDLGLLVAVDAEIIMDMMRNVWISPVSSFYE